MTKPRTAAPTGKDADQDDCELQNPAALRKAAREQGRMALDVLAAVARDGASEASRISAANAILDRGFGKVRPEQEPPPERKPIQVPRIVHVLRQEDEG